MKASGLYFTNFYIIEMSLRNCDERYKIVLKSEHLRALSNNYLPLKM